MNKIFKSFSVIAVLLIASNPAFAHTNTPFNGLTGGFIHPIVGLDHVTAMMAVGILAVFLGKKATGIVPIIFPIMMVIGGIMSMTGVPVTNIETGIASSSIVFGVVIALALKMPLWVASLLVGIFAIFHGYAHGTELPHTANPVAYSVGFVLSTSILHLTGIVIGKLLCSPKGMIFARAIGALIALTGAGFLAATL